MLAEVLEDGRERFAAKCDVLMPIYEYACPKCCVVFNFLSKKVNPAGSPRCPKCAHRKLTKQMSRFAMVQPRSSGVDPETRPLPDGMPGFDDPKMVRAMAEMEQETMALDHDNPRHLARILKKLKAILPASTLPKEFDQAVKRLEGGEDPETLEAEMGPVLDELMGGNERPGKRSSQSYTHDPGLYDF